MRWKPVQKVNSEHEKGKKKNVRITYELDKYAYLRLHLYQRCKRNLADAIFSKEGSHHLSSFPFVTMLSLYKLYDIIYPLIQLEIYTVCLMKNELDTLLYVILKVLILTTNKKLFVTLHSAWAFCKACYTFFRRSVSNFYCSLQS